MQHSGYFASDVMKRVFSIIGWTAGAFIVTSLGVGFASGLIFFFLAMSGDKSEAIPRFIGWVGMIVPFVVAVIVLLAGLRGRLPGTRQPSNPSLYHETIGQKSAITLHPKPAFFEWVAAVAQHHPLGWSAQRLIDARETIAWIIPSCGGFDSDAALEAYLDSFKPSLLASELRAVFPTETRWPELSSTSFNAFLELHVHPHVASIKHLVPTSPA